MAIFCLDLAAAHGGGLALYLLNQWRRGLVAIAEPVMVGAGHRRPGRGQSGGGLAERGPAAAHTWQRRTKRQRLEHRRARHPAAGIATPDVAGALGEHGGVCPGAAGAFVKTAKTARATVARAVSVYKHAQIDYG